MKKSLLLLLFLLAAFSVNAKYADVNGDGEVTAADITALYDFLLNNDTSQLVNGDVNGDGVITAYDITAVYDELLNNISDEYDNDYWTVFEDVDAYLNNNPEASFQQIQQYLLKYGNKITTTIEDNVLFVKTRDGRLIHLDLNGTYALSDSNDGYVSDDIMNQLITDIETALGNPNESKASTKKYNSSSDSKNNKDNSVFHASSTIDTCFLHRRNIMVWSPWSQGESACDEVQVAAINNDMLFSRPPIYGKNCTLKSLRKFSDNDIVVIACHGNKKGQLLFPVFKGQNRSTLDSIYGKKGYHLTKMYNKLAVIPTIDNDSVKKYFPKDLSKTILWTVMCHSYTNVSEIRSLATKAKVADFFGADNIINAETSIGFLKEFLPLFSRGATSEEAFKAIEKNNDHSRFINYSFWDDEKNDSIRGIFYMSSVQPVKYFIHNALHPQDNLPRSYIRTDKNLAHNANINCLKLVSNSLPNNNEAGFWFKNMSTGEETHVPFSQSSIENIQETNYNDIISQYVIEGNTDALNEPGNYEYRTYFKDNGTYYYSDNSYELVLEPNPGSRKAYAVLQYNTLTFYYDDKQDEHYGTIIEIKEQYSFSNYPEWKNKMTKVVFDISFANYKPTSTAHWFSGCNNLTTINNINYLNTSKVTDMTCMFNSCYKITSLDLSLFDTSKVTNMYAMFGRCESLKSIDLSSFNTSNVTDMTALFGSCISLTSLDLSNFNTSKVSSMHSMFYNCESLTSLDLTSFNTNRVTNMFSMFSNCESLTSLDLTSFNTNRVTNMSEMFSDCESLITIYAGNWNEVSNSSNMFLFCENLRGGQGTKVGKNLYGYDSNGKPLYYYCSIRAEAAHIDGGKDWPGLFTGK